MNILKVVRMKQQTQESRDREEWVSIGVIYYDAEADVVTSLFESAGIPLFVQGRHHRRMMGFLGGQVVELRLLAPRAREAEAQALLADYITQRDRDLDEDEMSEREGDAPPRLLFNRTGQQMGVALLAAFLGFGLASLSAGVWGATLLLAPLQVLSYWPDAVEWTARLIEVDPSDLRSGGRFALPLIDLAIAWGVLITRSLKQRSAQK